jgi:hypothetical protein
VSVRANFLEDAINSLTVALKNSPVNEGKKALAKAQAGQYDEAATRAKVEQYIADNPVSHIAQGRLCFLKQLDMATTATPHKS